MSQRQLLKVWDLPDTQPDVFTQRVWLNKGAIPFVSWTNGISSKDSAVLHAELTRDAIPSGKKQVGSVRDSE